jgi:hypothetical protein
MVIAAGLGETQLGAEPIFEAKEHLLGGGGEYDAAPRELAIS